MPSAIAAAIGAAATVLLGPLLVTGFLRTDRLIQRSLSSAAVVAIAAAMLPGVSATTRRVAVLALVALVMALVRIRPDLSQLRIETRVALRLIAGSLLWQVGVALRPSGRPAVDFFFTVTLFAAIVTAFDLRREPDVTDLLNGLSAATAFVLLGTIGGQLLIAPGAGLVAGVFAGLLVVLHRRGTIGLPGVGPALGTALAALAMLTGDAIATEGMWRTEVVIASGALIVGPAVVGATIVILDRLRSGFSPLAERDDRLMERLTRTPRGRTWFVLLVLLLNLAHSATAIALGRTSGSLVLPTLAAMLLIDITIVASVLRRLTHATGALLDAEAGSHGIVPASGELRITARLVEPELLRPGVWIRRSRLVWAHRDAAVPRHLHRTRIRPEPEAGDPVKGFWLTLLAWTIRRRVVVPTPTGQGATGSVDILIGAKDGQRVLHMDTRAGLVTHRHDAVRIMPREVEAHARTFEYLRGARIVRVAGGGTVTQELLDGRHLLDVPDEVRIGALGSLLLDVIALTAHTSQLASSAFPTRSYGADPMLDRPRGHYRTVIAPATQSLDNVILTGSQEIAWIETLPLVECLFHLPWFGVATRLANRSPVVAAALEGGAFDPGMRTLLRLGGIEDTPETSMWEFYGQLPWTRVPIGDPQASGR